MRILRKFICCVASASVSATSMTLPVVMFGSWLVTHTHTHTAHAVAVAGYRAMSVTSEPSSTWCGGRGCWQSEQSSCKGSKLLTNFIVKECTGCHGIASTVI